MSLCTLVAGASRRISMVTPRIPKTSLATSKFLPFSNVRRYELLNQFYLSNMYPIIKHHSHLLASNKFASINKKKIYNTALIASNICIILLVSPIAIINPLFSILKFSKVFLYEIVLNVSHDI